MSGWFGILTSVQRLRRRGSRSGRQTASVSAPSTELLAGADLTPAYVPLTLTNSLLPHLPGVGGAPKPAFPAVPRSCFDTVLEYGCVKSSRESLVSLLVERQHHGSGSVNSGFFCLLLVLLLDVGVCSGSFSRPVIMVSVFLHRQALHVKSSGPNTC